MPVASPADRLLLSAAHSLVDDSVGVLHALQEHRMDLGLPPFFHYAAHVGNVTELGGQPCASWSGAAASTRDRAAAQALADALASYCAASRFQALLPPVCPARSAPFPCLAPAEFDWFAPAQFDDGDFPWQPFTEDTPVQWAEAFDPLRDETLFVPAALVFHPHPPFREDGEIGIAPTTSTGLICHADARTAAIDALADCIECDALSLLWYAAASPAHIRVETLSDANYELISRFERSGGGVTLLRVPSDFSVGTVLAVLSSPFPSSPAIVCAAGTALDPELAVCRSLELLAHAHQYCQRLHTQNPEAAPDPDPVSETQAGHLGFWCRHDHRTLFAPLLASTDRIGFDELENRSSGDVAVDLQYVLREVAREGHRGLLADISTPDIAALGLTIVRAVVPGLCPILFGPVRPLGSRRLLRAVRRDPSAVTRRAPHPFPRKGVYR